MTWIGYDRAEGARVLPREDPIVNGKIVLFLAFFMLVGCQRSWEHSLLQGENPDVKAVKGREWMPPQNPDDGERPVPNETKKSRERVTP